MVNIPVKTTGMIRANVSALKTVNVETGSLHFIQSTVSRIPCRQITWNILIRLPVHLFSLICLQVCKRMDMICQRVLNQGFLKVERYHSLCQRQVKAQLPRSVSHHKLFHTHCTLVFFRNSPLFNYLANFKKLGNDFILFPWSEWIGWHLCRRL